MALSDAELVQALRALLAPLAQLACAELFGSVAAGRAHSGSDVDVLLVVDVADRDALYQWGRDLPWPELRALEEQVGREIQVVDSLLSDVVHDARRGGGFYVTLYSRPRLSLVSSLDQVLPADALETLKRRALAFLERCDRDGALEDAYRPRLAELRAELRVALEL